MRIDKNVCSDETVLTFERIQQNKGNGGHQRYLGRSGSISVILDYSFGKVRPESKTHNYRDSVEMDKIILVGGDIEEMARKYCGTQVLNG